MQKVIRSSGSDYVVSSSSGLKSSKPQYKKFLSKDCSGCSGYFLCSSGHSPKQLKWRTWKPTVGWNITVTGELNTACQWMKGNTKLQTLFQRKGLQGAPGFEPTLVGAVSLGCTQGVHRGLRGWFSELNISWESGTAESRGRGSSLAANNQHVTLHPINLHQVHLFSSENE